MRLSWLRRQFGGAPVSVLALALLVLGCVFVAVAGPRYSLHSRTRVLQRDLAVLTPVDRAVQVSVDWNSFASQVSNSIPPLLDDSQLSESQRQLARFLTATPLPLGSRRHPSWLPVHSRVRHRLRCMPAPLKSDPLQAVPRERSKGAF